MQLFGNVAHLVARFAVMVVFFAVIAALAMVISSSYNFAKSPLASGDTGPNNTSGPGHHCEIIVSKDATIAEIDAAIRGQLALK